MSDYRRGFGLVIGFIDHLYNLLLHFTNHYRTQTSVLSLLVSTSRLLVAVANGECSPYSDCGTIHVPQLPASNSNGSQRLNCSSPLTDCSTNSLHSTALNCAVLTNRTELGQLRHIASEQAHRMLLATSPFVA
jgi:hypothetical protein